MIGTLTETSQLQGTLTLGNVVNIQNNKTISPSNEQQIIKADTGFDCLKQITLNAIPYEEEQNEYGTTIIIGG